MAGDSVNLMLRSSKKSCEKYRPPELQKTTTKRDVVETHVEQKTEDELLLTKFEEIPEYNSKIDYQWEYHKLFQENEMKLQQYDQLLKERE